MENEINNQVPSPKSRWPIIAILFVIIIGLAAWVVWRNWPASQPIIPPPAASTTTIYDSENDTANLPADPPLPVTSPLGGDTEGVPDDWQTYRNEKYGFEFRHPPNLVPYTGFSGDNYIQANVSSSAVSISPRVKLGELVPGIEFPFLSIEFILGEGNLGSNLKKINLVQNSENLILSQILSTFRFIK